MPLYSIEIWASESGTPLSFYPLITLAEATDAQGNPVGTPLSTSHAPLVSGNFYYYKARRVMIPDGPGPPVYSAFSAIQEAFAPYIGDTKGKDMDSNFGVGTYMGWGIQPKSENQDVPHKAQWVVENPSGNVTAQLQTFASRALRNTTARRMKTSAGRALFTFNIPFEATPNGPLALAMTMLFGIPTTTKIGGVPVTLTANAASAATSLTVTALSDDIPTGVVLNFSQALTTATTADAAEGATSLAVSALPSAIPSGAVLHIGSLWLRTTSSAAAAATSLAVTALTDPIASGSTVNYTANQYVTTTAPALSGATTVAVVALSAAMVSGRSATYGFKYQHVWKNTKNYEVATISQLIGDYVSVAPGCFANQMDMSVDFDMDTVVTPVLQGNALNLLNRYSEADAGLPSALTDNLNAFTMKDPLFVIDGVDSEEVRSVALSINRNVSAKRVLRRRRGVARHQPTITDISFQISEYMTGESFKEKYFGWDTSPGAVYGATCQIVYLPVSLEFATCVLEGDLLPYEFKVAFPKASIDVDDMPVNGPEEIMEGVTLVPNFSPADGTDAIFTLVNDQSLADIMTPLAPITPVPENHVTPYVTA